jgi:hypothetical protein
MGYGLEILHPPVIYAPMLAILALWLAGVAAVLIARRHRHHADVPARVDCFAVLVLAALLGAPIGVSFLVLASMIAALGLAVAWPLGAARLPGWAALIVAGLAATAFTGVGYAVAPGVPVGAILDNGIALAGIFALGVSLAAIARLETGRSSGWRWSEQVWIGDLMAALGLVFYASGVDDAAVWVGLALVWAALALMAAGTVHGEPGQRLLVLALPLAWALAILAILGLLAGRITAI